MTPTNRRRCSNCGETKSILEFPRRGYYKSGAIHYDCWCRTCRLAQQREEYAKKKKEYPTVGRGGNGRKGFPGSCDVCKFLKPCRALVIKRITRDVVIDGKSERIYLDPYCFVTSPLFPAFEKVYQVDISEPAVEIPSNARY